MNLPAALLSRFDLMWLILDKPESDSDMALAHHVLHVHREGNPPVFISLATDVVRYYFYKYRNFRSLLYLPLNYSHIFLIHEDSNHTFQLNSRNIYHINMPG
jgi:hypothetical protein